MSIILASFGKYAISDCPFIVLSGGYPPSLNAHGGYKANQTPLSVDLLNQVIDNVPSIPLKVGTPKVWW